VNGRQRHLLVEVLGLGVLVVVHAASGHERAGGRKARV